jgi:hypothetical protein
VYVVTTRARCHHALSPAHLAYATRRRKWSCSMEQQSHTRGARILPAGGGGGAIRVRVCHPSTRKSRGHPTTCTVTPLVYVVTTRVRCHHVAHVRPRYNMEPQPHTRGGAAAWGSSHVRKGCVCHSPEASEVAGCHRAARPARLAYATRRREWSCSMEQQPHARGARMPPAGGGGGAIHVHVRHSST